MKKYLVLVLSMLFMLSLSATAFAVMAEIPADTKAAVAKGDTQITIGGEIRLRAEMRKNIDAMSLPQADGKSFSWYETRVRLNVDTKLEKVSSRIGVEVGGGIVSGNTATEANYKWGQDGQNGAAGVYTQGNAKRGTVELYEAWIQYKGESVGVKAGHMPLALGNDLFFNHKKFGDDALVLFWDPTKQIHFGLLTIKLNEESSAAEGNDQDADAYVALAMYKSEAFNASADITYLNDGDYGTVNDRLQFLNWGVRGDTTVGPLKVKADLELQSGSLKEGVSPTQDLDFSGSAILLGASAKLDPVTVGLEFGIGSGDDASTANKMEMFVTTLSTDVPYPSFIYGRCIRAASGSVSSGIANTTYVKASGSAKIGPVDVAADLVRLSATRGVALGGYSNDSSDLGWEFDAKATYKLAKNLIYWIEGGYFMPGDAYKVGVDGTDPDNVIDLRHGLQLNF